MDLNSPVSDLPKIGPFFARKFEKLRIKTIENLFYHVPSRYLDYSLVTTINRLRPDETATIHAKIISIKNIYSKRGIKMQIGSVEDTTGKITVVWFNQPFLIKTLYPDRLVSLSGKVGFFSRKLCLTSPDYEILDEEKETVHTGRLVPIYPETMGLSSKWIRTKIRDAYANISIEDFLPNDVLSGSDLVSLKEAIREVHFPKDLKEAEEGRRRLAFNELLNLQLKSEYRKLNWHKNKVANKLKIDDISIYRFINNLPYKLTDSQTKTADEILKDMALDTPMNRLLEGDVGSGKTVVAAIGAFATFLNGYQSIIMAPTQILANQHYQTLKKLFHKYNIRISLLTSDVKKVELGRSDVFVGTHSLIHSKVNFDKVAFVVIDEQHRFGVEQRSHLVKKSGTPHVLTMTATPIPRTVALTTYGDLDLSVLTEMPKGRQKVSTWVVSEKKREGAYDWINSQITSHHSQCFIVCPLIEDSAFETMADVKSVTTEFTKLKALFSNLRLGLLHGRLKPKEKEQVLKDFRFGKVDILLSTPVVEVGIDIPNASVMVIEAAERFGLAQLHQLRGRVGRGEQKSYCLLFSNFHSGNAFSRLKAMEKTYSGFELAELDLKLRGPGEIFGTAQSGFDELKIASWNNFELIKQTKEVAEDVFKYPKKYPRLVSQLKIGN
ncbi:MAG: ATP-dependent DNA helicase RecG [Candidatus Woesebacteria bacterium GW2011_GWA2_40_7b]|uniref:ATP-dependent DNA helicase RecG n=1 Tax=Candidatus Woesebacteria bacterium GW2011_GWA2_40_7b TaxID=1618563 RepID=A0A0G0T4P2_9BACT|nr:MAG: ATP-dependent DNA helicase RecG [Candidatus Woesebacteria bacterium GW2011_GWA2_40_7b]